MVVVVALQLHASATALEKDWHGAKDVEVGAAFAQGGQLFVHFLKHRKRAVFWAPTEVLCQEPLYVFCTADFVAFEVRENQLIQQER